MQVQKSPVEGLFYNFMNSTCGVRIEQIESYSHINDTDVAYLEVVLVSGRTVKITNKHDINTFLLDVGAQRGGGGC